MWTGNRKTDRGEKKKSLNFQHLGLRRAHAPLSWMGQVLREHVYIYIYFLECRPVHQEACFLITTPLTTSQTPPPAAEWPRHFVSVPWSLFCILPVHLFSVSSHLNPASEVAFQKDKHWRQNTKTSFASNLTSGKNTECCSLSPLICTHSVLFK